MRFAILLVGGSFGVVFSMVYFAFRNLDNAQKQKEIDKIEVNAQNEAEHEPQELPDTKWIICGVPTVKPVKVE